MDLLLKCFIGYLIFSGLMKSLIVTCLYIFNVGDRGEGHVKRMSNLGGILDFSIVLYFSITSFFSKMPMNVSFGDLLGIHSEFVFYTDKISLLYLLTSFLVIGLVGRFSCFYLHKDKHYYKFFALFYIFQAASVLLILSDNFASYFIGWELLGISSVLLISFYVNRTSPVKNSLRIFTLYKVSDILLFSGFATGYAHTHLQLFTEFSHMSGTVYSTYMLLMSLAIMIKMGGFPLIWLPRAMEGPTPSSAVFYGSLATHIPLLMFIKLWSGAEVQSWLLVTLSIIFISIIVVSTLFVRVQSDAKNMLAYATVKHLSIISMEVIIGFTYLAYIHAFTHCFYRLVQFMKTPSLLYDYQKAEGYNGSQFMESGKGYEFFIPEAFRSWVYNLVLKEFYVFPRIYRFIDILIGTANNLSKKKIKYIILFNTFIFLGLLSIGWYEIGTVHPSIFFLTLPWIFSLVALLINHHDWRYAYMVFLSVVSLSTVIFYVNKFIPVGVLISIQLALFIILGLSLISHQFSKREYRVSDKAKIIILILSLWLVGVPGPGTYYMFEKVIHLSMDQDMYLAIGAFVILSINTLAVIKHYSLSCLELERIHS